MRKGMRLRPRLIRDTMNTQPTVVSGGAPRARLTAPVLSSGIQSVASVQTAVIQEAEHLAVDFSTTTTGAWQEIVTEDIRIPIGNHVIHFIAGGTYRHTAANAVVSFRVAIYKDETLTGLYRLGSSSHTTGIANAYETVRLGYVFNIPVQLPLVIPGVRRLTFESFTNTAGTLTVFSNDISGLAAFVVGDAT